MTLRTVKTNKRLWQNLWTFTEHVLVGLRFLHGNNIIHCDIKPSNIMLHRDRSGRAKAVITDLGVATTKGQPIGGMTPNYALFGQGHPALPDQDLFALVMTVYTILLSPENLFTRIGMGQSAREIDDTVRSQYGAKLMQFKPVVGSFVLNLERFHPTWPGVKKRVVVPANTKPPAIGIPASPVGMRPAIAWPRRSP